MRMRGCEHVKETERARRGLLSTLHADIETSCGVEGLHISGSKRVSSDGALLSIERQARKVPRLRNEAASCGLAVQVELCDLENTVETVGMRYQACQAS